VLLTAASYVLLQGLRARLATTPAATLQVPTLRERLFKLGARVQVSAGGLCSTSRAPSPGSPSGKLWPWRSGRGSPSVM